MIMWTVSTYRMVRMPLGRARVLQQLFVIISFVFITMVAFNQILTSKPRTDSNQKRTSPTRDFTPKPNNTIVRNSKWRHKYPLSALQKGVEDWEFRLDPHNYTYLHNSAYKCWQLAEETEILLVIFVNSAANHTDKRAYIREKFGNESFWPTVKGNSVMRLVFLVGATYDTKVQDDIHFESLIYDDIVQEEFVDNYINMTLKTIMGMKWVTKYCRRAKYTMKVDDDVLINIPRIYSILRSAPTTNFTLGRVNWAKPIRTPKGIDGKFYTPEFIYPGKYYPPYFNGHMYILSTDVVAKVYDMATKVDLFPWSDVFVGICLKKLGIRLKHSELFNAMNFPMEKKNKEKFALEENQLDIIREYVSVFHFSKALMDQLWDLWNMAI